MPPATAPLLDEPNARFIQSGVAIEVASHEAHHVPVIARAVASRVSSDRRRVTVFLDAARNRRFLNAVAASGSMAAVFCHPNTLETIQLKGDDAGVVAAEAGDATLVARAADAFVALVIPLGFSGSLARRELHVDPESLAAVAFTIGAAFVQTPGPTAGTRI